MEQNRIDELVAKYNEGVADPAEVQQLEKLIEAGQAELTQLRSLDRLEEQVMSMEVPATSLAMDDKFYAMLAKEKKKQSPSFAFEFPSFSWLAPRLAFALVLIAVGFGGGYLSNGSAKADANVIALSQQLDELKETMMLSMLEKESASDRLKAVSLTSGMDQVSQKVTTALFETLNNDPSVNVRLSALDAIIPYSKEVKVRSELIRSIGLQDSPLVQVALAELMVKLQEKKSVKEFEKILRDDKTPDDVKDRIKESINILI
jgi:HEAT repeats